MGHRVSGGRGGGAGAPNNSAYWLAMPWTAHGLEGPATGDPDPSTESVGAPEGGHSAERQGCSGRLWGGK